VIIDGGGTTFGGTTSTSIRDYSDLADTVDLTNNSPSGYHTRMMGGNDRVTLSNSVLAGFSNKVNGNKGDDIFFSKAGSLTRDFILGGSENDRIDLSNSASARDWQNGNNGNDTIIGAIDNATFSILRGGSENDTIIIKNGSAHIAVGDLGKDIINTQGQARIVCRTDNGAATQFKDQVDEIIGFSAAKDKAYIPGVLNKSDLYIEDGGDNTIYLKSSAFTNGTPAKSYIVGFRDSTTAKVQGYIDNGQIVTGVLAEQCLASLTPSNFLINPDLGGIFA
jgi:hypothetical protein